jgi:hypothetical protein
MAATTLTATTFNNPPIFGHGPYPVIVTGTFNSGATAMGTALDTVFLCKIPHGAVIIDAKEDHSSGATSSIYSLGLATGGPGGSATYSCFIASGAGATVNRVSVLAPGGTAANTTSGVPYLVSASDNDPNRYGILAMQATSGQATATTSLIINWYVIYHTRGGGAGPSGNAF